MTEELIYDENTEPTSEEEVIPEPSYRPMIRNIVRTMYDLQRVRIALGGRIFALFCKRFNLEFNDEDKKKKADKIIKEVRQSYYRIIDAMNAALLAKNKKVTKSQLRDRKWLIKNLTILSFPQNEKIQSINEMIMVDQYEDMLETEKKHVEMLEVLLEAIPFYNKYFKNIRGVGPMMAGVLISEINIYKAKYSSSIHMYAGLDVVKDKDGIGKGRTNKKEHLIKKKYINKDGEEKEKDSITYNPFLKTKLMGVLAGSFIRLDNIHYRKIYDDYKNRLQNRSELKDHSKLHINNMSKRYMIKQFLNDLHENWRKAENLPVYNPYEVEKLGHRPHNSPSC
jgi:hypothetical protein